MDSSCVTFACSCNNSCVRFATRSPSQDRDSLAITNSSIFPNNSSIVTRKYLKMCREKEKQREKKKRKREKEKRRKEWREQDANNYNHLIIQGT
eukprot:m.129174 g.129174  ORF g.129174 m.129174 type:complete len:94 (-) comp9459_c1_seq4:7739-8020(-)